MKTLIRVLLSSGIAVLMAASIGCGATVSTYLILSAQAELDGADAAEAPKYAPYEYRSAQEYLHKAREEQGYSDFGPAIEYAFKAQEMAEKGKTRSLDLKNRETPPPSPGSTTIMTSPEESAPTYEEAPKKVIIQRREPEPAPAEPAPAPVEVPIAPIQPQGKTP